MKATPDNKPETEILTRDAQRFDAVVDHDFEPVDALEDGLLDALELGVEDVGLGV